MIILVKLENYRKIEKCRRIKKRKHQANEEAKIKRDQYEKQLQVLSEQLKASEPQIDLERLYQEDPAEFVKQKAEQDRRKELQVAAQQEQDRIRQEKQQESEKTLCSIFRE